MKNKEQIAKIWDVLDSLNVDVLHNKQAIIKLENEREQNSLIERKELTGSDLCRAMLERGDSRVVCLVSDVSDEDAREKREITSLIEGFSLHSGFYTERSEDWVYAVPVNVATNEPLTATDVGL